MIRLYHDADGRPLFTMAHSGPLPRWPDGDWIEIGAAPDGALSDWQVVEGALVRVSIEGARVAAIGRINAAAGAIRRAYVTELPGQEMVYLQKEAEAVAFLSDADPDPADYPFLAAEVGATADTLENVAQVYLNMAALFRQVGAALEHLRLGAIAAVESATTAAGIEAALATFTTDLEGLS